jgi:hypothetical protein
LQRRNRGDVGLGAWLVASLGTPAKPLGSKRYRAAAIGHGAPQRMRSLADNYPHRAAAGGERVP